METWLLILSVILLWGAWHGAKIASYEADLTTTQRVAFFIASPFIAVLSPIIVFLCVDIVLNGAWKAYLSRLSQKRTKST